MAAPPADVEAFIGSDGPACSGSRRHPSGVSLSSVTTSRGVTTSTASGVMRSLFPAALLLARGRRWWMRFPPGRTSSVSGRSRLSAPALGRRPAAVTAAELPGPPVWLEPVELAGGGIALSWEEPGNAADTTVTGYEVAIWKVTGVEPPATANVSRESHQLGYTYLPGVIPPGCQYTARVRAVGENGRGGYAYMVPAQLSGPVCEDLLPAAPTGVKLEVGAFSEVSRDQVVSVGWTQGGDVEPQFHVVRFSSSAGVVNSYTAVGQPHSESVSAGEWKVDVRATVAVDGERGYSAWSTAATITVAEPPPFVVKIDNVTVMPQARHGCRPFNGPVEGTADAHLVPGPLPYAVTAEVVSHSGPDVVVSSARNFSLDFTFAPGEVSHPLLTWVDCDVVLGEVVELRVIRVMVPGGYSGRVIADPTLYSVVVGDLTPVPALPLVAAFILAGLLAALGVPVFQARSWFLIGGCCNLSSISYALVNRSGTEDVLRVAHAVA